MMLLNFHSASGLCILFLVLLSPFWCISDAARGFKRNFKTEAFGVSKSLKNGGLFPSTFNVATKADIYVNATCGEDGPETFCKPSESARCAVCDARSPDPGKRHNISNVLNPDPGKWWQSPTLAKGERFEYVTIILDLKQTYQIENVIVKAANSPRPAAWVLERSVDGEEFRPWQYYAPSDEECWTRYSVPPVSKPIYAADDEVICTSLYSRQTPMENGEIHIQLLNGRPGAQNHSETLQDFTQARYVRLSFQGLRRGGGALADKRRAFYSIKEISIGGRCLCSGHASRCRYSARHGLQERLIFSENVQAITLSTSSFLHIDSTCVIPSWNSESEDGTATFFSRWRLAVIPPPSECWEYLPYLLRYQICVANIALGSIISDPGDSGAPVVCGEVLVGLITGGDPSACLVASVLTISPYMTFISSVINGTI